MFPYWNLDGSPTGYSRVKPEKPRVNPKKNKPQKYEAPRGRPPRLHFPKLVRERHQSGDPILITEGEKKSLCGCQEQFLTIGLNGIWSWSSNCRPPGDFDSIAWASRKVFIAFDSDRTENPKIRKAELRLAEPGGPRNKSTTNCCWPWPAEPPTRRRPRRRGRASPRSSAACRTRSSGNGFATCGARCSSGRRRC
ncbi:DUF3854 domain-containing protein [Zavarzinella formosa]|uniref:DUF3854 domain-containing protein n=1 Tax=Zavarzinella formosa TaxID=360055 RepID=UPI000907ABCD